jgi:hypothetical protein
LLRERRQSEKTTHCKISNYWKCKTIGFANNSRWDEGGGIE